MLSVRDLTDARAAEFMSRGVVNGAVPRREWAARRLARVTGLLYLVLALCGTFALIVLESLVVRGDAPATADRILGARWLFAGCLLVWIAVVVADVALAVALYVLLKPLGHGHSLIAAALRLVYSGFLGAVVLNLFDAYRLLTGTQRPGGPVEPQAQAMALSALERFNVGFLLALAVLGAHLFVVGVLLYRSRYVPRALALLIVAAGVGYLADGLGSVLMADHVGLISATLLTLAVVGELGLAVWLLAKGVGSIGDCARSRTWARSGP
jgi:hypothetical protein